jgi:hypothetical protein
LQAVKFWLPKAQKQDITAELAEDIRSHIDEKEAERYLPQRHLIGPVLFPIYRFVLKLVLFVYLVPWLVVWI